MTKAINKMLAVVLSFAMILTGFTFLGGAVAVNAVGLPSITNVIVDPVDSGSTQPAAGGVFAWFIEGTENPDFADAGVSGDDFSMQVKAGTGDWADSTAAVSFELDTNDNEGIVTATVPDNEEAIEKQWRFVYEGGFENGVECPAITQAAAEAQIESFEVTFDPGDEGTLAEGEETATTGADGKLASLPTPTVTDEDLVFAGWFMFGPDGEDEIDVTADTVFTSNAFVFARYENVWDWNATDFVYGEWQTTRDDDADYEPVYPGNEHDSYLTDKFVIVTGFSDVGLKKVEKNRDLVIPETDPEGNQVKGIGKNAFSGASNGPLKNTKLKSVSLPEDVFTTENIYNNDQWKDFSNRELEKRGAFVIGYGAFDSNEITDVYLPEGVLSIGTYAFRNNLLESVRFPSTLMVINAGAFSGTKNKKNMITDLEFSNETDFRLSIRSMAFANCEISEVVLPKDSLQVALGTPASTRPCAFTGNPGMEPVVDTATNLEKKGGVVYLYMNNTPDTDISLIAHTESATQYSANQKLITDSAIVEVKQAVQDAETALEEAWIAEDQYGYAEPEDREAALANAEAKAEAAAKAADTAQKAAEEAKAKYPEDSAEADLMEESISDAKSTGVYANKVLASVKMEAANAASAKASAMPPGDAAVAAAQVAADKANEAKAAADKAVAAMKDLGYGDEDASDEMKQELADAEGLAQEAGTAATNANNALAAAKTAAGNAQAASAAASEAAAREGTLDPSLPKVKAAKPKAAKKAVTAKWKKLSKKDQKKAAQIEIWVCPDKNFAAANTKEKVVGKKKASVKVGGLSKKTTYYVKVRAIKNVNGVKYVGPWSKVKKIKTKK